jgi:hypothetical protein
MNDARDPYRLWAADRAVLAEIGARLFAQQQRITVRLPRELAAKASAAWNREESERLPEDKTPEEKLTRYRAGFLALIGLAVSERGLEEGDEIVVDVTAWEIGESLNSAEDSGLLGRAISDPQHPM